METFEQKNKMNHLPAKFSGAPSLMDHGEDPHPSLSDWHDYEPNLEFDDTELSQTAPEPGGTVVFDEDNFSGEFEEVSEDEIIKNTLDQDNYEEQLTMMEPDENAIRKEFKRRKFIEFIGTDKHGQPIIAIYACSLPERKDLNTNIFIDFIIKSMEEFVQNDYIIAYFHQIAPLEVIIPAQNTGLGPEKTSFFQALSIPTKISKGTIEIINDVPILKPGDKVGASEATLLNMLNISPFSYGLQIEQVYDSGSIFSPDILDIKPEDLRAKFQAGVANLAAVSLEIGYPTLASVPHSIANGFRNLLAIAAVTEVEFKEAETVKEFIKDPSKFAAAAAPAASAAAAAPAAAAKEAPKEESESEDDDMGFGLFD